MSAEEPAQCVTAMSTSGERIVRHGKIRYVLNREHPLLQGLVEELDEVNSTELLDLFTMVESALPLEAIFADFGGKHNDMDQDLPEDPGMMERLADAYVQLLRGTGVKEEELGSRLLGVEPFCRKKEAVKELLKKWGIDS